MKRILYISFAILGLTVGFTTQSHAQDPAFEKAAAAISKMDAATLSAGMNASVELTIPGADGAYTSNQAQFMLKDFFAKFPATGFSIMHKGTSGGASYATGSYKSAKGNFDVNIFVKNVNGQFMITAIRFEAE
jgi:Domain of unknown function (DUF4783)